ncbi:molybdopterin-binding protein [Methylobacterium variabile]|uniref:Molybdopterin molybdenumtransferase n=1 Tax=Methylobacterium variabile TaxID=298794 RepID=A0A0J6SQD9_9HYPH|nr:molybdopterin-binding protein [Methylobacterium variabile]KMO35563.1 molybdopterin-binding protein [Methylobacterium variabile]
MPLAEAVAELAALASPVAAEDVSPPAAVGAVSARDVVATTGLPTLRTALRDGWAVSAAAVVGASPYAPLRLARAPAWVEAGAPLPAGTDALLPPEAIGADPLEIEAEAAAGEGTRAPAAELPQGARLVAAGERVSALHCLALASAGLPWVSVRRPRLRLLAAEPDTLSPVLHAWIAARGGLAETAPRPAEAADLAAALLRPGADAVVVIGGTGPGRTDRGAEALARAGRLHAHGIALRPGESAGFGAVAGLPVLLLPGRPDAALAAWLALGRPLLAGLAGAAPEPPQMLPLTRKVTSVIGLAELVFLRRTPAGAEPLGGAEIPLHRLGQADAALLVPPAHEGYPAGTPVEVLPL